MGWDEARGLWFVADGMGGHASGDVASRIVKETLLGSAPGLPLRAAVMQAHDAVAAAGADNTVHANMGSTVVATRIAPGRADIVWVGDSRAYLWRGQILRQLTRDHSYLEVLRAQEHLSDAQMRSHPNRNLVTQTLGIGAPEPALTSAPLRTGDWLLLCSDGLNDELEDAQIEQILCAHTAPEAAADALIDAALARGGRDNVTAVVVEYDGPDDVSFRHPLDQQALVWLAILGGACAALLCAVLWWWLYGR